MTEEKPKKRSKKKNAIVLGIMIIMVLGITFMEIFEDELFAEENKTKPFLEYFLQVEGRVYYQAGIIQNVSIDNLGVFVRNSFSSSGHFESLSIGLYFQGNVVSEREWTDRGLSRLDNDTYWLGMDSFNLTTGHSLKAKAIESGKIMMSYNLDEQNFYDWVVGSVEYTVVPQTDVGE